MIMTLDISSYQELHVFGGVGLEFRQLTLKSCLSLRSGLVAHLAGAYSGLSNMKQVLLPGWNACPLQIPDYSRGWREAL